MTLRVLNVPAPAVGREWSFTVPGQWIMDVVSITATLVTAHNPNTLVDSSPNAFNAAVIGGSHYTFGAGGPYSGGAGNFGVFCDSVIDAHSTPALGWTALNALFGPAHYSADMWVNLTNPIVHDHPGIWGAGATNPAGTGTQHDIHRVSANQWGFTLRRNTAVIFDSTTIAPPGTWQHFAATYDGTNWNFYVNGILVLTVPDGGTFVGAVGLFIFGDTDATTAFGGTLAGFAFYSGVVLSGAQVAAHAAAGGSNAAYKVAVLADAPTGLWMLDEEIVGGSRHVTLQVSDGTHTLGVYPGGGITGNEKQFTWTWTAQGGASAQSADAQTNVVAIPELMLPPGYVLSSSTLDLLPTDQWSNITLWFDDGTGPGGTGPGGTNGVDYLDARFVPDMPNG